jgi:hypothetical protein
MTLEQQIREKLKLRDAATKGPWHTDHDGLYVDAEITHPLDWIVECTDAVHSRDERQQHKNNCAFIASAHEMADLLEQCLGLVRDKERLDFLESEMQREGGAAVAGVPFPRSLFRQNMPITRAAIDAAIGESNG